MKFKINSRLWFYFTFSSGHFLIELLKHRLELPFAVNKNFHDSPSLKQCLTIRIANAYNPSCNFSLISENFPLVCVGENLTTIFLLKIVDCMHYRKCIRTKSIIQWFYFYSSFLWAIEFQIIVYASLMPILCLASELYWFQTIIFQCFYVIGS